MKQLSRVTWDPRGATKFFIGRVGEECFALCPNLQSVGLGPKVAFISTAAFCRCPSLVRVHRVNGGTTTVRVGANAFNGCTSLISVLENEECVRPFKYLGAHAFCNTRVPTMHLTVYCKTDMFAEVGFTGEVYVGARKVSNFVGGESF